MYFTIFYIHSNSILFYFHYEVIKMFKYDIFEQNIVFLYLEFSSAQYGTSSCSFKRCIVLLVLNEEHFPSLSSLLFCNSLRFNSAVSIKPNEQIIVKMTLICENDST